MIKKFESLDDIDISGQHTAVELPDGFYLAGDGNLLRMKDRQQAEMVAEMYKSKADKAKIKHYIISDIKAPFVVVAIIKAFTPTSAKIKYRDHLNTKLRGVGLRDVDIHLIKEKFTFQEMEVIE